MKVSWRVRDLQEPSEVMRVAIAVCLIHGHRGLAVLARSYRLCVFSGAPRPVGAHRGYEASDSGLSGMPPSRPRGARALLQENFLGLLEQFAAGDARHTSRLHILPGLFQRAIHVDGATGVFDDEGVEACCSGIQR